MPTIDEIFLFVMDDTGPGDEGMVSGVADMPGLGPVPMPLLGADKERVDSMRPVAQEVADKEGKPVRLVVFTVRRELEVLTPRQGG